MTINFIAVIVAGAAGWCISALWYSPYLFAKQWSEIMGSTWKEATGRFTPMQAMAIEGGLTLITAYVIAIVVDALNIHGPLMAMRVGFWLWLGFQVTTLYSSVLFERRPLQLFYINAGARLVSTLVMALVIGLWP